MPLVGVAQMVGHRTRLAQEWSQRRNAFEDRSIKDYMTASVGLDRAILPFLSGVPSGWMILGLLGLVPAFVSGSGTPVGLAIGLGGVLVANRALSGIAEGLSAAARAAIAWRQAAPLFHAGSTSVSTMPYVAYKRHVVDHPAHLIDAESVSFRYSAKD